MLAALAPEFDLASVSDAELASVLKASTSDHLHLQRPQTHRRIGPLRIRRHAPEPGSDPARKQFAKRWLARVLGFA